MVYCNILALSVLKLYFDARKINKSMQNELFKRSNTNARRELSFSKTFLFSQSLTPSFQTLSFRSNSQCKRDRSADIWSKKNKCMRKQVMSQALLVDFHLSVYLLVLYRICADFCIFLSKRLPLNVSFLITFAVVVVFVAFFCAFYLRILDAVCIHFMRSRLSLSFSQLISFFTHLRGSTDWEKKKKHDRIYLITMLITSEKSRFLHITSDKKYEHRTLKIPIWAFHTRIQRIILLCSYEMNIVCGQCVNMNTHRTLPR